jgi:Holliday junction resolvasome RuvABC endonuclease subunit
MIWGIDIGVRTAHAFGITENRDECTPYSIVLTKGRTRYEELRHITQTLRDVIMSQDLVFVEEPPMAGPMNKRTFGQLSMTAGAILSATSAQGYVVPVSSWKKVVVGNGSADKVRVASWLAEHYPGYAQQCRGDQNLMDAACIAIYGRFTAQVGGAIGIGPGSMAGPL